MQLERDSVIKQRVTEAVDKYKIQAMDEKQQLLLEASKQLQETVSNVKVEMEGKLQQTQALAVQETLKEVNAQSSSSEVWTIPWVPPSTIDRGCFFFFKVHS